MSFQNNLSGISVGNHRKRGAEFEQDLIATHHYYELKGIAKIDRHPRNGNIPGLKNTIPCSPTPKPNL
jgi:hypothetical protein